MLDGDTGPGRAGRTVVVGACLLAALTAAAIALVAVLAGGAPPARGAYVSPAARLASTSAPDPAAEQAKIYAALLAQQAHGRRYVIERECGDIAAAPNYRCTGRPIDAGTQRALRVLAGPALQFGPPRDSLLTGGFHGTVVGFGPLALTGGQARLSMEIYCGPLCGNGATYELHRQGAAWRVTGTVGPEWIS